MSQQQSSQVKRMSSYPRSWIHDLRMIQLNSDEYPHIMGSSSYKSIHYPSDLDSIETFTMSTHDEVIEYFVKEITKIVKYLSKDPKRLLLEVKCGLDPRFDVRLGPYTYGYQVSPQFLEWLIGVRDLMKDEDFQRITRIVKQRTMSLMDYETTKKIIRSYYIIRWKGDQILDGYKIHNGRKFTLSECVDHIQGINIEVISCEGHKLMDQSNYYILGYNDPQNPELTRYVNLPERATMDMRNFFLDGLTESMVTMIDQKLEYNPMKYLKRLYSYTLAVRDTVTSKGLLPILNSDLGHLYQLKSQMGTICKFIEQLPGSIDPYWGLICDQVQQIKYQLGPISSEIWTDDQLDQINGTLDNLTITNLKGCQGRSKRLMKFLTTLKDHIMIYVNQKLTLIMKVVGLLPVPITLREHSRKHCV